MKTPGTCLLVTLVVTGIAVLPNAFTQSEQSTSNSSDLMRRYASAYLKLAEVQYESRLQANEKVPNAFSAAELDRFRMNVGFAEEQLRLVSEPDSDRVDLHLRRARLKSDIANEDYRRALRSIAESPGAYSDLQMREFQLRAEVARLRLAIWSNPGTNVLSLLDHMHWQIERLSEDVLDLQQRMDALAPLGP